MKKFKRGDRVCYTQDAMDYYRIARARRGTIVRKTLASKLHLTNDEYVVKWDDEHYNFIVWSFNLEKVDENVKGNNH